MIIEYAFKVRGSWAIVTDVNWPVDWLPQLGEVDNQWLHLIGTEIPGIKIHSVELALKNGTDYVGFRLYPNATVDLKQFEGTTIEILQK